VTFYVYLRKDKNSFKYLVLHVGVYGIYYFITLRSLRIYPSRTQHLSVLFIFYFNRERSGNMNLVF
jgi:hypothetical protein